MKHFFPLILASLLAACVAPSPVDQEAAHQRELAKEAEENFYALKAQINPHYRRPATPTPTPGMFALFQPRPTPANQPAPLRAPAPKPSPTPPPARQPMVVQVAHTPAPRKPVVVQTAHKAPPSPKPAAARIASNPPATPAETPKAKPGPTAKNQGDTVHSSQVQHPEKPATAQIYSRYEIRYAHDLDKTPAQLTPEERSNARKYYLGITLK
jgi:hypothetical protein